MRKISSILLIAIVSFMVMGLSGCTCSNMAEGESCSNLYVYDPNEFFSQYGETEAEGHRRHLRILNLARQGIMDDLDSLFLFDQPSKLSKIRIK